MGIPSEPLSLFEDLKEVFDTYKLWEKQTEDSKLNDTYEGFEEYENQKDSVRWMYHTLTEHLKDVSFKETSPY